MLNILILSFFKKKILPSGLIKSMALYVLSQKIMRKRKFLINKMEKEEKRKKKNNLHCEGNNTNPPFDFPYRKLVHMNCPITLLSKKLSNN